MLQTTDNRQTQPCAIGANTVGHKHNSVDVFLSLTRLCHLSTGNGCGGVFNGNDASTMLDKRVKQTLGK